MNQNIFKLYFNIYAIKSTQHESNTSSNSNDKDQTECDNSSDQDVYENMSLSDASGEDYEDLKDKDLQENIAPYQELHVKKSYNKVIMHTRSLKLQSSYNMALSPTS